MHIVICEDEALIRRGLELLLREGGHDVVAAVPDAEQLVAAVDELHPALVITDIRLPPTHTDEGLAAALALRRSHPELAVVVLSQYVHRHYARDLLATGDGGVGYLLKQRIADVEVFLDDLDRVGSGGTALDPEVISVMVGRATHTAKAVQDLTPRQRDVLALIAEGHSNASIAGRLHLSEKAVVQHSSRIYDALGLAPSTDSHRRVQAVLRYLDRV